MIKTECITPRPKVKFRPYDSVKITVSRPSAKLKKGAGGTIMDIYDGPQKGYEVSFNKHEALETFAEHELRLAFPAVRRHTP